MKKRKTGVFQIETPSESKNCTTSALFTIVVNIITGVLKAACYKVLHSVSACYYCYKQLENRCTFTSVFKKSFIIVLVILLIYPMIFRSVKLGNLKVINCLLEKNYMFTTEQD